MGLWEKKGWIKKSVGGVKGENCDREGDPLRLQVSP
jgi:hypothetical protein